MTDTLEIPHSLETEQAFVAALLMEPAAIQHALQIGPEHFYSERYRRIYLACAAVFAERGAVDGVMVFNRLREDPRNGFKVEDIAALCKPEMFTYQHARYYVEDLKRYEVKRRAVIEASRLQAIATEGDALAILAGLREAVRRIEAGTDQLQLRSVDLASALELGLPPVPWLVDGWVGEGDIIVFAGEWATGKSIVALDLAIAIASGRKWMRRVPIQKTGPVLYVDEENNARNIQRRAGRMLAYEGYNASQVRELPIRYLSRNMIKLDTQRGRQALYGVVEEVKPVAVVLDSMVRFHSGDENKSRDVAALFAEGIVPMSIRYGAAVVTLDHMKKPAKDDEKIDAGHRVRGSGDKAGVGDGLWTLEGDRETDSRTLSCRKNRWEDSLPPSMTTKWCVSENEKEAWLEASDATLNAEVAIRDALNGAPGGITATRLYEAVALRGINKRTAQRAVKRMVAGKAVELEETGRHRMYSLPQ